MQKFVTKPFTPRLLLTLYGKQFSTTSIRNSQFYDDSSEVVKDIHDGATILLGGFGTCGVPENCLKALHTKKPKNLTIACITSGIPDFAAGLLVSSRQVKRLITTYIGANKEAERQYAKGEIEVEFTPQGTLVERIRAGGAGIPAFYVATGYGTLVQTGGSVIKFGPNGKVAMASPEKPTREYNGRGYVLEEAIFGDFALVKAWKADRFGNVIFRKTARNINPTMAKSAKVTIVEVEDIVDEIEPDHIHLPHIFVHRIVKAKSSGHIESIKYFTPKGKAKSPEDLKRDRIARRAVLELKKGMCVNLGVGVPLLAANFIKPGTVTFQSENGILGLGPFPKPGEVDPDLTNAARESVTAVKGASYFSTDDTFGMIRGGHLDWTFLGALQVSRFGDLANWMVPGKLMRGMGGAMDLVSSIKTKVMITMEHTEKNGVSKIVDKCTLPLTGKAVVNMIVTEMGVFNVDRKKGLTLIEIADGVTLDQVKAATACKFHVSDSLKPMAQADELE